MRDVRAAYDTWSDTYDTQPNKTRDLDAELLRAVDWDWTGLSVLEIGCGTGKNTGWLAERAARVVGLDLSPGMLARACLAAPCAELKEADLARPWPVDSGAFDVVLANLVLEHLRDLAHVAREAARALRPRGKFRVAEYHPWRQHQGKGAWFMDGDEPVATPTFVHTSEEYVSAGLQAGLTLTCLHEPTDPGCPPPAIPRLLVLTFEKRA